MVLARLHSPPPVPVISLLFLRIRPSLYPFRLVVLPTMRQKENVSPGFIIMPEIFAAAMRMFTALFCCVTGSMPLPVLISTDVYEDMISGSLSVCLVLAKQSFPKRFFNLRATMFLCFEIVQNSGLRSQKLR